MKDKTYSREFLTIIFTVLLVFVITSPICATEKRSRSKKTEILVLGQHLSIGNDKGKSGIDLEYDNTTLWGLSVGYNFNDYLNLNTSLFHGSINITGEKNSAVGESDGTLSGVDINLDYNILKRRFSPMLTGGFGVTRFKGEDIGGSCTNCGGSIYSSWSMSSRSNTTLSYNVGAGFRWDVTDHFLVKAIYKALWTDLMGTDTVLLNGISLNVGFIF